MPLQKRDDRGDASEGKQRFEQRLVENRRKWARTGDSAQETRFRTPMDFESVGVPDSGAPDPSSRMLLLVHQPVSGRRPFSRYMCASA